MKHMISSPEEFLEIAQRLSGPLTNKDLYPFITENSLLLTKGSEASFFLYKNSTLVRSYASNAILFLSNKPRTNGRTMRAFLSQTPQVSTRLDNSHGDETLQRLGIKSILFLPVLVGKKCIGVINILFDHEVSFSENDFTILLTFGKYVGRAYTKLHPDSDTTQAVTYGT